MKEIGKFSPVHAGRETTLDYTQIDGVSASKSIVIVRAKKF